MVCGGILRKDAGLIVKGLDIIALRARSRARLFEVLDEELVDAELLVALEELLEDDVFVLGRLSGLA